MFPATFNSLLAQIIANSDSVPLLGMFGVAVVFMVAIIYFAAARRKKIIAAWAAAAEELGITFRPPTPKKDMPKWLSYRTNVVITGKVAGFHVKVHNKSGQKTSSNRQPDNYTVACVTFPMSLDLGLSISRQSKLFGAGDQDITTGDEAFDKTFAIYGSDAEAVSDFLTDDRRQQLTELNQGQKGLGVEVTDTTISISSIGVVHKAKVLTDRVTSLTRVAFTPVTGRTHQLRVHAAHPLGLGIPIAGDPLYGTGAGPGRLMLHACDLGFEHPSTGEALAYHRPPPF